MISPLVSLPEKFSALGDPTRFLIVERLLQRGELSAGELQDIGQISAPAISRHLKVLRQAGLIDRRVEKQRRIYRVRPDAIHEINAWSMSFQEFWTGSLDRLAGALDREKGT